MNFNTAIQVDDDGSRPDALLRDRPTTWTPCSSDFSCFLHFATLWKSSDTVQLWSFMRYHGVTGFSPYPSALTVYQFLLPSASCRSGWSSSLILALVLQEGNCTCICVLAEFTSLRCLHCFLISSTGSKASKVSNHAFSWVCLDSTSNVFWSYL